MSFEIKQLYYITHIDNIASILENGILSHYEIQRRNIKYTPIYDEGIITNRKYRTTPEKKSLWEYANLYFQPRNPMLYRVLCEISSKDIAVLGISLELLKLPGVFITNGNAASPASEIIPSNNWEEAIKPMIKVFNSEYWKDEDGSKRKIMAECLVPEKIIPKYIKEIYIESNEVAERIKERIPKDIAKKVLIIPEPKMFFKNPLIIQLTSNLSILTGDMFLSRMHTLTISVNIVGVMGKGLASRAKYQFPDVYVEYQDACRKNLIMMGKPYLYKREKSLDLQLADESFSMKNANQETWFLLFPTKRHWRENADFDAIQKGMEWLKRNYEKEGIRSLAIPALGCGLGNLNWKDVGPMLCRYLVNFNIPVQLYLPAERKIAEEYLRKDFLLSQILP